MKVFRFPLDRALHIRRTQFEIEQAAMQALTRALEHLEQEIAAVEALVSGARSFLSEKPLTDSDVFATMPDFQRGSKRQLEKIASRKTDLLEKKEDQKSKLLDAERKVKMLERLRTRRFADWSTAVRRDQENFAAEAFLARWAPPR